MSDMPVLPTIVGFYCMMKSGTNEWVRPLRSNARRAYKDMEEFFVSRLTKPMAAEIKVICRRTDGSEEVVRKAHVGKWSADYC